MSVYQFVAFDTLFMYLFIYSFSILFYLLCKPWRNWDRVALVIGKLRVPILAGWKVQVSGDKSTGTEVKIGL